MVAKPSHPTNPHSLRLGFQVVDGETTASSTTIPQLKRTEHMAILGRTGTGKSSLLRLWPHRIYRAAGVFSSSICTVTLRRPCCGYLP